MNPITLEKIKDCKKVVVIGAGFIGVEIADELNKNDKDVTLVEILPNILDLVFDKEVAIKAEEIIKERGVKVESGSGVKELLGDKKVDGVLLNNGKKLEADAVILSMGYRTNTVLAKEAGIEINEILMPVAFQTIQIIFIRNVIQYIKSIDVLM